MNPQKVSSWTPPIDPSDVADGVEYVFSLNRRHFVQLLGAGLVVATAPVPASAQSQGGGGGRGGAVALKSRLHIGEDGVVTVLTGKVEIGQGARAQLTQAAAEELQVPVERVRILFADTARTPDDGVTAGSRTTPSTVPAVRRAAAAARALFVKTAATRWGVEEGALETRQGNVVHPGTQRAISYVELLSDEGIKKAFEAPPAAEARMTPVEDWKVLGTSVARQNQRDLVTGAHRYPSDITRPGMLHGAVLRPPTFGAKLVELDTEAALALRDVKVVRDGDFVGVVAPTSFQARRAVKALADAARWESAPHPSSAEVYDHLRRHALEEIPTHPFTRERDEARWKLRATYRVAYAQHAPMETRSALAEWEDGKLTVWTGTQAPTRYVSELSRAFRISDSQVRVIVPDSGGGFGGKHSGEAAVEAARLAQSAGKPVLLRWSREEEFTWAYFRPAALIEAEATLNAEGRLTSWHFLNINSGGSAVETPYRAGNARSRYIGSQAPLRQGSYRALASTANTFARECVMDELAHAAGVEPLEFRLAHLENERLRAVLEEAAKRFGWADRVRKREPGLGVGLACGTEKGSFVAACVEVRAEHDTRLLQVREVCEVFECGAVMNPVNLLAQVQGAILMGLGPALSEAMEFDRGAMKNATFRRYLVPRFMDVPKLDVHLLNRPDLPSVGGGETPIIAVAPAIGNAVFHACGVRIRQMPIQFGADPAA